MARPANSIPISAFDYALPNERIAKHPLPQRDASKLLVAHPENLLKTQIFSNLADELPTGSRLFLNETKVVPARLVLQKETGARIEIFCLEPVSPSHDLSVALSSSETAVWRCLVGNAKKWKAGQLLSLDTPDFQLIAEKSQAVGEGYEVRFNWSPKEKSFAEILTLAGQIPLPPYLNREPEATDLERYQTVFAQTDGAVAAPTASLHFTDRVLEQLADKDIRTSRLTLHVGAGTFKPVTAKDAREHAMHAERIVVPRQTIEELATQTEPVIAVGTTSLRTLESMFWFGVGLMLSPAAPEGELRLHVSQWLPYNYDNQPPTRKSVFAHLATLMHERQQEVLKGETELMVIPEYELRVADAIITNFHQPKSTLMLLIASVLGDRWKAVYDHALSSDYRFLSYGDSSLLWRHK